MAQTDSTDPTDPTDPTRARPALPLVGVRVLECGDTIGAAYAGRLLADLGADVVKVEPPSGDILRHLGPTVGGVADPEASAGFGYFHAGKRSIVVDANDPRRRAVLRALAAVSDVVIRCTRSGDDWLSDEELAAAEVLNPGLIVVDISTWGRAGADHSNSDLIALAAGGLLSVNGTDAVAAKSVPLRYRGEFSSVHAACDAVLAALGALHARLADGRGQRLDISAQAATASILATAMSTYLYTGVMPVRDGVRGVAPWGFYTCRDGVVLLQVTEDPQWFNLRRIIGEPEWAQPDVFDTTAMRAELHDVIDPLLEAELRAFSVDAFLAACQREGVAAARIQDAKDLLAWPHLRARNYFTPVEFAARPGTEVIAPTPPWRFAITPSPEAPRVSPALGADEACLVAEWQPRPSDRAFRDPAHGDAAHGDAAHGDAAHGDAAHGDAAHGDPAVGPRPLAGLRVIDMTWVWAGPFCATQLAHLGADVIKFESTSRIDVTRRLGPFAGDEIGINRSGYFNQYNQGKRSVVLDVKDPRGLAALKRVIATADLIIDNMRPGALARMGLPMEELRKLNPKIVAVAMSGFGESGPERDRMAYGSIIDALSGVAASNGMPGGGPTDFPMSLPDPAAGIHAAIASVAALYRARRTGIGDRVEVAMLEATLAAFPWPMLIEAAGAGPVAHEGNRDATMSPHGTFPCVDDDWLALAVRDDTEFAALAGVLDQPALIVDPRFAAIADRKVNEDELERLVSAWTRTCGRDDAVARLRHAGVTAERVLTMAEVAVSPALTARDFMQRCPHPEVGERPLPGPAWVASRSPMRTTTAAPCFGQHTREVMHEVLGLTEDEIQAMDDDGLLR